MQQNAFPARDTRSVWAPIGWTFLISVCVTLAVGPHTERDLLNWPAVLLLALALMHLVRMFGQTAIRLTNRAIHAISTLVGIDDQEYRDTRIDPIVRQVATIISLLALIYLGAPQGWLRFIGVLVGVVLLFGLGAFLLIRWRDSRSWQSTVVAASRTRRAKRSFDQRLRLHVNAILNQITSDSGMQVALLLATVVIWWLAPGALLALLVATLLDYLQRRRPRFGAALVLTLFLILFGLLVWTAPEYDSTTSSIEFIADVALNAAACTLAVIIWRGGRVTNSVIVTTDSLMAAGGKLMAAARSANSGPIRHIARLLPPLAMAATILSAVVLSVGISLLSRPLPVQWESLRPRGLPVGETQPIEAIATGPDGQIIISTTSGIFRARIENTAWEPIGGGLNGRIAHALAFAPDGQTLVAGASNGDLFYFAPESSFWQLTPQFVGSSAVRAIISAPDGVGLLAGSTDGTILRSIDNGRTWALIGRVPFDTPILALLALPDTETILAGTEGNGVVRSDDGGASWAVSSAGMMGLGDEASVSALALGPDSQRVYAGTRDGRLMFSDNEGRGWQIGPGLNAGSIQSVVIAPDGTNILVGANNGIIQLSEQETSYTIGPTLTTKSVMRLAATPDRDAVLAFGRTTIDVIEQASIRPFTNDGITDRKVNHLIPGASGIGPLASTPAGIFSFDQATLEWRELIDEPEDGFGALAIAPRSGALLAISNRLVLRYDAQQRRWTQLASIPLNQQLSFTSGFGNRINTLIARPGKGDLWMLDRSVLWHSNDDGITWRSIDLTPAAQVIAEARPDEPLNLAPIITSFFIDPVRGTLFVAAIGGIARSDDDGLTWQWVGPRPQDQGTGEPRDLIVGPDGVTLYAASAGSLKWLDSGIQQLRLGSARWEPASAGLSSLDVWTLSVGSDGQTLFAGTDDGVFRSTDDGASWHSFNQGLPLRRVRHLALTGEGNGILALLDNGATYLLSDEGVWQPASHGLSAVYLSFWRMARAGDALDAWANTAQGYYQSTDNGANWRFVPQSAAPPDIDYIDADQELSRLARRAGINVWPLAVFAAGDRARLYAMPNTGELLRAEIIQPLLWRLPEPALTPLLAIHSNPFIIVDWLGIGLLIIGTLIVTGSIGVVIMRPEPWRSSVIAWLMVEPQALPAAIFSRTFLRQWQALTPLEQFLMLRMADGAPYTADAIWQEYQHTDLIFTQNDLAQALQALHDREFIRQDERGYRVTNSIDAILLRQSLPDAHVSELYQAVSEQTITTYYRRLEASEPAARLLLLTIPYDSDVTVEEMMRILTEREAILSRQSVLRALSELEAQALVVRDGDTWSHAEPRFAEQFQRRAEDVLPNLFDVPEKRTSAPGRSAESDDQMQSLDDDPFAELLDMFGATPIQRLSDDLTEQELTTFEAQWRAVTPLEQLVLLVLPTNQPASADRLRGKLRDAGAPVRHEMLLHALEELEQRRLLVQTANTWQHPEPELMARVQQRLNGHIQQLADSLFHAHPVVAETLRFLEAAGFSVERPTYFDLVCTHSAPEWRQRAPLYIALIIEHELDINELNAILGYARQIYGQTAPQRVVGLVFSQTPTQNDLHTIAGQRGRDLAALFPMTRLFMSQARASGDPHRELLELIVRWQGQDGRVDLYEPNTPAVDDLSFFGRRDTQADIQRRLVSGRSVALLGIGKIGKSSLMLRLREMSDWPVALIEEGYQGGLGYIFDTSIKRWCDWLRATQPGLRLPAYSAPDTADPATRGHLFRQGVEELLEILAELPNRPGLLLFIDEFDTLWDDTQYMAFAAILRGVTHNPRCRGRFALLVAGRESHYNWEPNIAQRRNPFYEFFSIQPIALLDDAATRELITSIGAQMGYQYDPAALDLLTYAGGGHPFLTRRLCSQAILGLTPPTIVDRARVRRAIADYLHDGHSYMADHLWNDSTSGPRAIEADLLRRLAGADYLDDRMIVNELQPLEQRRAYALARDRLREYGLILRDERGWTLTIPIFRDWIRRTILNLGEAI